jgi:quercetin dioxygenase-like cupin family protein
MSFVDARGAVRFDAAKMRKVNLFETPQMFCDVYCLEPGQAQKPHAHAGATKFYYVVEGTARFTLGSQVHDLGPGHVAWSAPDEPHGVENASDARVVLLVAMAPRPG